jgi:hypothetical protein
MKAKVLCICLWCILAEKLQAQEAGLKLAAYEGIVVAGYVDEGAYLNFTGPNINLRQGRSRFILGMLPSLRFKEDRATPKNAFVVPGLGVGFTYAYKHLAIQLPLYYNAKTATQDGRWHAGIGLGWRW